MTTRYLKARNGNYSYNKTHCLCISRRQRRGLYEQEIQIASIIELTLSAHREWRRVRTCRRRGIWILKSLTNPVIKPHVSAHRDCGITPTTTKSLKTRNAICPYIKTFYVFSSQATESRNTPTTTRWRETQIQTAPIIKLTLCRGQVPYCRLYQLCHLTSKRLEVGLYKILFCFWDSVHESILFFAHPPFV